MYLDRILLIVSLLFLCQTGYAQKSKSGASCSLQSTASVAAIPVQLKEITEERLPSEPLDELIQSAAWNVSCSSEEAANRTVLLETVRGLEGEERALGEHLLRLLPYTYTEFFIKEGDNQRDYDYRLCPDHLLMDRDTILCHIRLAKEARAKFPWCAELTNEDFLRYTAVYRGSYEKLENWRKLFWEDPELQDIANEAKNAYQKAASPEDKTTVLKNLIYIFNSGYLAKKAKYTPRGMPDQSPLELFKNQTGRCTDLTNALLAICRTYGLACTGARSIWWGKQQDNHYWAAIKNPADGTWFDVDGASTEAITPVYFKIASSFSGFTKMYWIDAAAIRGKIRQTVRDPRHPWAVRHYLFGLPMVDKTNRYTPVGSIAVKTELPEDTPVYLCCWNWDTWLEVAVERTKTDGSVQFDNVGGKDGILYHLKYIGEDGEPHFIGRPGILTTNSTGSIWISY